MIHRTVVMFWVVFGAVSGAPPCFAAAPEPRTRTVLAGVKELEKPVTYTEAKIPLGELVAKVARDTGVTLTAAPDVSDEPVAVVVKDFPARELLEQIADLLDYRWSRRSGVQAFGRSGVEVGDASQHPNTSTPQHPSPERPNARTPERPSVRYVIYQDLASKQREEALRDSLRADVQKRFHEELQRYVEIAKWPPEQIQKFREDAHRPTRAGDPGALERARRFSVAGTLTSPISRAIAQLLGRLAPEQWAALRESGVLTFSSNPQPGELRMPPETARLLRAARPTLYPPGVRVEFPNNPDGPEQTRRIDRSLQEQWAAATGYRVRLELDHFAWRNRGTLSFTAKAMPDRANAPAGANFFDAYAGTSIRLNTEPLDFWSRQEERGPLSEDELAKDPVFGARQIFRAEARPRPEPDGEGNRPMLRPEDLLPDLARTYNIQILSDAYTSISVRLAPPLPEAEPKALFSLLQRFASHSHRWDRRGRLVRLRSRTWFLDRPREIPLRLTRRWKGLQEQRGALPLATYVEMATSLTDLQMESLPAAGREVGLLDHRELSDASQARYALRLYAALAPAQRQSLWDGAALTAEQMTPAQRTLFLASLKERSRYEPLPKELKSWTEARLTLASEPYVVTEERHGAMIRRSLTPAPPPDAAPPPPRSNVPRSELDALKRYPVTRLQLHLQYGAGERDTVTLLIAVP